MSWEEIKGCYNKQINKCALLFLAFGGLALNKKVNNMKHLNYKQDQQNIYFTYSIFYDPIFYEGQTVR